MSAASFLPSEQDAIRTPTVNSLRLTIQAFPQGPAPDGRAPRLLPPLGFAPSVVLEPAAMPSRRLLFSLARLYRSALALRERAPDIGDAVAALIVVIGVAALASPGLWRLP